MSSIHNRATVLSRDVQRREPASRTESGWLTFEAYVAWLTEIDPLVGPPELPLEESLESFFRVERPTWSRVPIKQAHRRSRLASRGRLSLYRRRVSERPVRLRARRVS